MPIDTNKRQSIEEITDGKIKKTPREVTARGAGREAKTARPAARRMGRSK